VELAVGKFLKTHTEKSFKFIIFKNNEKGRPGAHRKKLQEAKKSRYIKNYTVGIPTH